MIKIEQIISVLESMAPPSLQETYDNSGLIIGDKTNECIGVLVSLDVTEDVINEAIEKKCNLIISHHPLIFRGLKKINGRDMVDRCVVKAIKHDIAIFAIHTNLDNVLNGVNGKIAALLGLRDCTILAQKENTLRKLSVFTPATSKDAVLNAMFGAGAGNIGSYSECSFASSGTGSFKALEGSNPYIGNIGERHYEPEVKLEVIFSIWKETSVVKAMLSAHPYESVAYDIFNLANTNIEVGSGLVGMLPEATTARNFFQQLSNVFDLQCIRYSGSLDKPIKKVAVCGGAGSFLIKSSINNQADIFITSDLKYHEFFEPDDQLILADIGHFESEQFTTDLIIEVLNQNFPNFATLKTGFNTNPVKYWLARP